MMKDNYKTQSHDSEYYENLIRRLKLLSVSQTAFLKAFLHVKLSTGASLVNKSIDLLSNKDLINDNKANELKNALLSLKLDEIEVDVNSTQIMMHEELSILRGAIDSNDIPASNRSSNNVNNSNSNNTSISKEQIQLYENEINKYKDLYDQTKFQLESQYKLNQSSDLKESIKELQEKLLQKDNIIKSKDNEISSLQIEINNSRAIQVDKSQLENQMSSLTEQITSLELKLSNSKTESNKILQKEINELNNRNNKRIEELQAKAEAEKEEMMEAMSQEIEEIENTKKEEFLQLTNKITNLENSLVQLSKSKQILESNYNKIYNNLQQLIKVHKLISNQTKVELKEMNQSIAMLFGGALMRRLRGVDEQMNTINNRYKREMQERKRLHNLVQELKGNIRVFMRCRPPTTKELEQFGPDALSVTFPNPGEVKVFNEKNREKVWEFDEVFGVDSTQEEVYKDVADLVISVLDGFNVCIFAYGQTGSGKTFTMSGPPDNRGVNTRALNDLFERSQLRSKEYHDVISVSILEVYNEDIRDLLVDPSSQEKLEVRQGDFGNYVPGLTSIPVNNLQQVIDLLSVADRHRSSATTNMNEHSSRSHMMLTVTVVSENKLNGVASRGKLNLVDLAGSERINKSGATGQALKEAQNINKSLSALGDVIAARAAKQGHVPFRNSTLTYLLQDSISQDSKTLMIVCASPMLYNSEETFCSLNFAAR